MLRVNQEDKTVAQHQQGDSQDQLSQGDFEGRMAYLCHIQAGRSNFNGPITCVGRTHSIEDEALIFICFHESSNYALIICNATKVPAGPQSVVLQ